MSTISSTTPRSVNMTSTIALAIALITLLAFVVAQSATAPEPAVISVTGIQNAYVEYLRGEKAIYLNPIALNEAVSAYHLGEKPIADVSNALFIYRVGEKTLYTVSDLGAALAQYLAGEKVVFESSVDLGAAMTAYHTGEKIVAPSLESALLTWRQGEKDAK